MTKSIDEFKDLIDKHMGPVMEANSALVDFDERVDAIKEESDEKFVELQDRVAAVLAEKVLTDTYLKSLGYPVPFGRRRRVEGVEPREVPVAELVAYLNDVLSDLSELKSRVDTEREALEEFEKDREPLYREYVLAIKSALDSNAVSRQQLEGFGLKVPSNPIIKKIADNAQSQAPAQPSVESDSTVEESAQYDDEQYN